MKSRDNLLRLKHFQVEDKTRQLTQIEMMIGEFTQMATELDRQIQMEEEKSGIPTPRILPIRPLPRQHVSAGIILKDPSRN